MRRYARRRTLILVAFAAALGAEALAQGSPTPQERVAALKQWLKASRERLHAYQWIETTVITQGGEEKSRRQNTCYYGVDGTLQKVPVAGATEAEASGGPLRKRIAAHEKKETEGYLEEAAALVHGYIPPDPMRIQQAVDGGRLAVNMLEPGRRVRLDFKDYLKPGDVLGVEIEVPTNRLLGIHVSSYLDDPKDAVELDVAMGELPDGTIYTKRSTLTAPAKDVTVTVENTGYRKNES